MAFNSYRIDRKYFKTDLGYERHFFLCDEIIVVMLYTIKFCESIGLPVKFTDTVTTASEDALVSRLHDQHRRCVAVDLSVFGWTLEQRTIVEKELDTVFSLLAYVTASGKREIAFCHNNGNGWHFHIAVNAKYKLPEFKVAA